MPRTARKLSESGIYHIMVRGINRNIIFRDENDIRHFLQILSTLKKDGSFALYGYCFMSNHVHLLLHEKTFSLSEIMRRLGSSYVSWHNRKYDRIGYLFQDRFKSEPVEDNAYFLTVLRYIHQNPFKAGLISNISEYQWSSYPDYLYAKGFTDIDFALNMFHSDRKKALNEFTVFHLKQTDEQCLDIDAPQPICDQKATEIIIEVCKIKQPSDLLKMDKTSRRTLLNKLKVQQGLSIRQIERLTGINRNTVYKS